MDDVVVKTGILLAIVVGVGAASWYLQVGIGIAMLAGPGRLRARHGQHLQEEGQRRR